MDVPTGEDIRSWAPPLVDWDALGLSEDYPDPLDVRAAWAASEVETITGRPVASIQPPADGTAAPNLVPIAQRAITLKVLINALGGSAEALEVLGAPWLAAFSAGSYSESRFSPAQMAGISGRGAEGIVSLGGEPLATLLWLLMTPAKQDEWRFLLTGVAAPASTFIEQDWGGHGLFGPLMWGPGIETW